MPLHGDDSKELVGHALHEHTQRDNLVPVLNVVLAQRDWVDLALQGIGVESMLEGKGRCRGGTVGVVQVLPRSSVRGDEFSEDRHEIEDYKDIERHHCQVMLGESQPNQLPLGETSNCGRVDLIGSLFRR